MRVEQYTVYEKISVGKTFVVIHDFSLNHKPFPANHGLVDQQRKSIEM